MPEHLVLDTRRSTKLSREYDAGLLHLALAQLSASPISNDDGFTVDRFSFDARLKPLRGKSLELP